jgi:glyoxylase-like metal-dependent hydrolase (beta-lactamase superfamily II)
MRNSLPYRTQVGDFAVWAISDGELAASLSVIRNMDLHKTEELTGLSLSDPTYLPVNTFLIEIDQKLALVDTGAGQAAGSALGKVRSNLESISVSPNAIDYVLLTHLHPDIDEEMSERTRRNMEAARRAIMPYRNRIRRISDGQMVLPGITAVALPGHTPGHTGWLLESDGERLLLWGDIVHFTTLQTVHPEASLVFDVDQLAAQRTRQETFKMVSREQLAVAGNHLPFPGFGHIVRRENGYCYEPEVT